MSEEQANTSVELTAWELQNIAYAIAKASPAARGKIIERLATRVHANPGLTGLTALLNSIYYQMASFEDVKAWRTHKTGYRNPATRKHRDIYAAKHPVGTRSPGVLQ